MTENEFQAIAWAFDLFPPFDWGDHCDAELRMNDLWNKLVEIDRTASAAYRQSVLEATDSVLICECDAVVAAPARYRASATIESTSKSRN